jgi:hypothetical protein
VIKASGFGLVLALALLGATGCSGEDPASGGGAGSETGGSAASAGSAGKSGSGGKPSSTGGKSGTGGTSTSKGGSVSSGGVSGAPGPGEWVSVTGTLAGLPSRCGNVSFVSVKPDDDQLLVTIADQGIFSSVDGAKSWTKLGSGAGSDQIMTVPGFITYDPDDKNTYYVSGIYGFPGINKTTDNGMTFHGLGTIGHNDGMSVDYSDPERKVMLAGGHEQKRTVYRSEDGGMNWTNVGMNLPEDSATSSFPYVVNAQEHLVGCFGGPGTGIYRSTNAGASWTQVSQLGGGHEPLHHSDGSLYWSSWDAAGMVRSTDNGETWEVVTGPNLVYTVHPIELPDGRIATRGPAGIVVSADQGHSWVNVAPPEPFADPFRVFALAYSKVAKAFYVVRWTCDPTEVPADGLVKFDWDYEQ